MADLIYFIVEFVKEFSYLGIFIMTFVESTFVPIPAEITMIPAGYLASKGAMNLWLVILTSITGTICGAWFNYWIAYHYGRKIIVKYGHYFFMDQAKLEKIENYFKHHGAISTFTGRLVPGLRHYISFPAGLAKMNLSLFLFYTGLGGGIWMLCLILLGFFIGMKEDLVHQYITYIQIFLAAFIFCLVVWYYWYFQSKKKRVIKK